MPMTTTEMKQEVAERVDVAYGSQWIAAGMRLKLSTAR